MIINKIIIIPPLSHIYIYIYIYIFYETNYEVQYLVNPILKNQIKKKKISLIFFINKMSLKLSRTKVKKTLGISLFIATLKYQGMLVCIKYVGHALPRQIFFLV